VRRLPWAGEQRRRETNVTTSTPPIDLADPAAFANGQPHDQYAWLRANDPVHWNPEREGSGFWAVTRYDDVVAIGRDPETYSSYRGGIMLPDADEASLAGSRLMMLFMDPPRHTRYRTLVNRGFTRNAAQRLAARIEELAAQIIDAVIERGHCDLVEELAGKLPSYFIADVMGIPLEDGRRLYELTEIMHSADPALSAERRNSAVVEMLGYAASVARLKQNAPADDLATLLVQAEIDGDRLSEQDFSWFFLLLINAGGDTTRNLVAGGMQALFDFPEQRRRLQNDFETLLPTAVEEMLRWCSPVVHMRRTATRDLTLRDRAIHEGDKVVMFYGAANRDEAVFADADRFDVGRTPNEHVAFGGGGPHYCLGSHVARIEIAAMLRELLTRLPDIEPDGPTEWLPSVFISGPRSMPVRFTPGPPR
jgi:cytochrome P450